MFEPRATATPRRRRLLPLTLAAICVPLACGSLPRADYARPPSLLAPQEAHLAWSRARHVFESRCVVCHGCYDAPCQLKLGTFEGIDRGASEAVVYDGGRLLPASPTRLEIDAHDTAAWRDRAFHAVLPEGRQRDPRASLLVRMLDLKRSHPLPPPATLATAFTFELDRKQTCTTAEHFDAYAKAHPYWGMPYGLPGLEPAEEAALVDWVKGGAPHDEPAPLAPAIRSSIAAWESFLNEPSKKSRLAARYIYEHLFLASLYFEGIDARTYFRLVRSTSPTGAVDEIPTRRPFDDPKVERVYYRLVRRLEEPLSKTHMPYPLSPARLHRVRELFLEPAYTVDRLPTYEPQVAANPFRAFQDIPAESRYRFMLDEAEFTIMGFIKGPVCRGQVALNVIEDRFWVTFMNPALPFIKEETAFLASVKQDLDMPAEGGSFALPTRWFGYARDHERYLTKKNELLRSALAAGDGGGASGPTLRMVWDGDGKNTNAALTVFRHFDSASVVRGLVGGPPKTAWVIGYPLLERIHYLLVAGFDVFGNVGHQLTTRLYMDFLRMEGEANFLLLLPPSRRQELIDLWYRGVSGQAKERVSRDLTAFTGPSSVHYERHMAEQELFPMLQAHLGRALVEDLDLERVADVPARAALSRLGRITGIAASWLPELSFVAVRGGSTRINFTIARESGHTNVMHLFNEDDRRLKGEDALAVVPGFLGAYPNALFEVAYGDLDAFVDAVAKLDGAGDYFDLRTRFGVLRSSERFWAFSDRIHDDHRKARPDAVGLFDYSRLDVY